MPQRLEPRSARPVQSEMNVSIDSPSPNDDLVTPFRVEGTDVRGQLVRLGPAIDTALSQHNYPHEVSTLLGEALLLAVLTGSSLKFDGRIVLQTSSDGPVSMLIAEYTTEGSVRGYAKIDHDRLASLFGDERPASNSQFSLSEILGHGHLAISIDQGPDTELYQGLVALSQESLVQAALTYFAQSEQVLTSIRLSVGRHIDSDGRETWRAGGIMAQFLPPKDAGRKTTDRSLDDWERADILLASTEDHELIDPTLSSDRLLYRLYHEDGVRTFERKPVRFGCSCSEDRLRGLLSGLAASDLSELEEDGVIKAKCEFCSREYQFDPAEIRKD